MTTAIILTLCTIGALALVAQAYRNHGPKVALYFLIAMLNSWCAGVVIGLAVGRL